RAEDSDAYERGLRRRRWLGWSILPIAAVLGVGALLLLSRVDRTRVVRDNEEEPNNTPATANAVESGRPIRGQVGKRIALEESDRDFYRFHVDGSQPVTLRVELSPLPNMELMLEVFDGLGQREAEADNGGAGDGEVIPNLKVAPGEHYIAVREVWIAGRPATENISDWYTLKATWGPIDPLREVEPDDVPGEALPLGPGETMHGSLCRPDD